MTTEQGLLFAIFVGVFAMLLWGRWRYDLVAFCALLIGAVLGLVPKEDIFTGFGHPATIVVALVLVISRGLVISGAVQLITRKALSGTMGLRRHIALMGGVGALMSAFMNNVAALALLMPVDIQTAIKEGRTPRKTLMALSFATILGGLVTLIGTPPNIIVASYRAQAVGEPFQMFDFAPVGGVCALVGLLFVATIGWRLIPDGKSDKAPGEKLYDLADYVAELHPTEGSPVIGKRVAELDDDAEDADVVVIGLVRDGKRVFGNARHDRIREDDVLLIEASPDAIEEFRGNLKLSFIEKTTKYEVAGEGMSMVEVVAPEQSRIAGKSAMSLHLMRRQGVTLLGISRQGTQLTKRVRRETVQAGDILLLLGRSNRLPDAVNWLGCLPLAERGFTVTQSEKMWIAAGLFAAAIAAASFGLVYLPVALGIVVAGYMIFGVVPVKEVYEHIEWPVVVLLGSMIPLGAALETTGGAELIADGILALTSGLPAWAVLVVLMTATMTLSDVLNNTATTVVAAPIAIDMARKLEVSPDPMLMAVAVAASCAFLTPIGHKNNTLILGPGGYAFGDYWRMGLPLEILVIAVATPAILVFWPL